MDEQPPGKVTRHSLKLTYIAPENRPGPKRKTVRQEKLVGIIATACFGPARMGGLSWAGYTSWNWRSKHLRGSHTRRKLTIVFQPSIFRRKLAVTFREVTGCWKYTGGPGRSFMRKFQAFQGTIFLNGRIDLQGAVENRDPNNSWFITHRIHVWYIYLHIKYS